ncbi:uncharacterized protein LOC144623829 isoform X3 [Crassostrea virginica]
MLHQFAIAMHYFVWSSFHHGAQLLTGFSTNGCCCVCPNDIRLVFSTMPAAFAELEIPPVYALLSYLSLFICGFMFLCFTMLTIVDNIIDSMTTGLSKLHDRKHYCTFVTTFFLIKLDFL